MRTLPIMPVLIKEFRSQLRGSRAALLITIYIGLTLVAMRAIYNAVAGQSHSGPPIFNAQIGQAIFIGMALSIQTLTVFLAPATTVNSISSEHERRTFELLQMTPIQPFQLLIGKLIAGLCFNALMIVSTLPLFSVVVLFGGVGFSDILRVTVTLTVTAVLGCMLGLICSLIAKQTYSATLLCYAILVAVIGGTIFTANLWSMTRAGMAAPPSYLVLNPLAAMASALGRTQPPDSVTGETLQPLVMLSLLTEGTVRVIPGAPREVIPLYRATGMLYTGLSLLIFWIGLHLVQVRYRWRVTRADLVMVTLVIVFVVVALLSRAWWFDGLTLSPPVQA